MTWKQLTRLASVAVTACVIMALTSTASAVDWDAATGSFSDGANWAGGSAPNAGDEALINNGGTSTIGDDIDVASLVIGRDGGSGTLVQEGGVFTATGAFIGDTSTGAATITDGEFLIGNDSIHVGWRPGGDGTLEINGSDALVVSGDDLQLGREGTGTLNFSAGQLRAGFTVIGKFGAGVWNQTGGLFDQDFGDLEIGDGGRDDQASTAGPRTGVLNLMDGVVQTAGDVAIGNRRGGGEVNVSGGVLALTGRNNSSIYIGRGQQSTPGTGQDTTFRVTGGDSLIIANGNLFMNLDEVSASSTLVAEITGLDHTPILLSGSADIANGVLQVELDGYTPAANDSWLILQTGVELDGELEAIDDLVDGLGYEPLVHDFPAEFGELEGQFAGVDTTGAPLPPGLSWEVQYSDDAVVLAVTGEAITTPGDYDANGVLDANDINLLTDAVLSGENLAAFDVTADGVVDDADRVAWVEQLKNTYIGDSNLDGEFGSGDLVDVFIAGHYDDGIPQNSGWEHGDWNGDKEFDSGDFVTAFTAGGYEVGPRAATAAVPEPSSVVLLLTLLGAGAPVRRFVRR